MRKPRLKLPRYRFPGAVEAYLIGGLVAALWINGAMLLMHNPGIA